jgi:hypothetical protein
MKDKSLFWCVAGEILGFELRASHIFTTWTKCHFSYFGDRDLGLCPG